MSTSDLLAVAGIAVPILLAYLGGVFGLARWYVQHQYKALIEHNRVLSRDNTACRTEAATLRGERDRGRAELDAETARHRAEIARILDAPNPLSPVVADLQNQLAEFKGQLAGSERKLSNTEQALFYWKGEAEQRKEELVQANAKLDQVRAEKADVEKHRDQAQQQLTVVEQARTRLEADVEQGRVELKETTVTLEQTREDLDSLRRQVKRAAKRINNVMELGGQLWQERPRAGTPPFVPLDERRMPIISVLNLKGGVGKTTITAHLGAALARRGYRVLLVDLDLQGSLTTLFIPGDVLNKRPEIHLLQHFLSGASHGKGSNLLPYLMPILNERSAIIPTSENLAYAELNITMRWLLRLGRVDARFLLRRALHHNRISRRYDIVLLDCPPLLNTSGVNALVASDYVLIPVTPSEKVAERVPTLLRILRRFHSSINPDIQIAGLLANRTFTEQMTAREADFWQALQVRCRDRWGEPIHAFRTVIRQSTEVRESEAEFTPPEAGSELHTAFNHLVLELEERLPRDCRRTVVTS